MINNIIYTSLMLLFSLLFIVHLEVILNLWMKNYLCTVFWRFVSKEEAMKPNLICYQNFKRVIWGPVWPGLLSILWWYRVYEYRITKENYGELEPLQITSLNSILGDPGAANWDRTFRSLTATGKVYDKNRRVSQHVILPSHFQSKGLFTWRWGTPGRWGNPLRWGNPPIHKISHFNVIMFTC